ncbi:MAG: S8 family peptidase [Actinomycetota bacterium]
MTVMQHVGFARGRRWAIVLAAALFLGILSVAGASSLVPVVATGHDVADAARAVRSVGGRVTSSFPFIGGVAAQVPADRVAELSRIIDVSTDRALHVRSASFASAPDTAFPHEVGAVDAWPQTTGRGVGVALVDTGVAPVPDLLDHLVAVADVTPEKNPLDRFGHGTFMAGLLAGDGTSSEGRYTGVAPDASLVSIKVAVSDGSTTLGTVLAGLQLVHGARHMFNIRVVLLAMSAPSTVAPERDPLSRALRKLWDDGIFVVVPAGNDGPGSGTVDSPGNDPMLMTAGAVDDLGTNDVSDDAVVDWTSRGPTTWGAAKPELAAPGAHIVSLRAPGSSIDVQNPAARVGDAYFRGSGTSMSAAITAGVATLVLSSEPELTPDQLKQRLISDATPLPGAPSAAIGAGVVHASVSGPAVVPAPGGGTLVTRKPGVGHWDGPFWDGRIWDGRIWDGRIWDGRIWDGRVWDGRVWDGRVWDGRVWDGRVWDGRVWDGRLWG